jgi:FixJ family two-component response regulator
MRELTAILARRLSIAIVDDDASVRVGLQRLCEVFGLCASTYASGPAFLDDLRARRLRVECLLLDAHMPEMAGLELHHHLVASGMEIPTIILTADDALGMEARGDSAGTLLYLRKPVTSEDLLGAIVVATTRCPPLPG